LVNRCVFFIQFPTDAQLMSRVTILYLVHDCARHPAMWWHSCTISGYSVSFHPLFAHQSQLIWPQMLIKGKNGWQKGDGTMLQISMHVSLSSHCPLLFYFQRDLQMYLLKHVCRRIRQSKEADWTPTRCLTFTLFGRFASRSGTKAVEIIPIFLNTSWFFTLLCTHSWMVRISNTCSGLDSAWWCG